MDGHLYVESLAAISSVLKHCRRDSSMNSTNAAGISRMFTSSAHSRLPSVGCRRKLRVCRDRFQSNLVRHLVKPVSTTLLSILRTLRINNKTRTTPLYLGPLVQ
jgi:hypothetical protein